jgi:hypothetical protein
MATFGSTGVARRIGDHAVISAAVCKQEFPVVTKNVLGADLKLQLIEPLPNRVINQV